MGSTSIGLVNLDLLRFGIGHLDLLQFGIGHLDLLQFGLVSIWTSGILFPYVATVYNATVCNAISMYMLLPFIMLFTYAATVCKAISLST